MTATLTTPLCPVCRQHVIPDHNLRVKRHRDSLNRRDCPASGQPWHITKGDQ